MAHTQGPWKIFDDGPNGLMVMDEKDQIFVARLKQESLWHRPIWDNARLIAAAPECLGKGHGYK
jgi:hypothetical protein